MPLLADNYIGDSCTDFGNLYLDIQYECYQVRSDEEIRITSIESIRDTPLRELYSDILHIVADPEGEGDKKVLNFWSLKRSLKRP